MSDIARESKWVSHDARLRIETVKQRLAHIGWQVAEGGFHGSGTATEPCSIFCSRMTVTGTS